MPFITSISAPSTSITAGSINSGEFAFTSNSLSVFTLASKVKSF